MFYSIFLVVGGGKAIIVTSLAAAVLLLLFLISNDKRSAIRSPLFFRILAIILAVSLLPSYFFLSSYFEKVKYEPLSDDWFDSGFYLSQGCVKVHSYYFRIDQRGGWSHNRVNLEKTCDRDFYVILRSPDVTSFTIDEGKEIVKEANLTNKSEVKLLINGSKLEMGETSYMDINTINDFNFYSYYDFSNSPIGYTQIVDFVYNGKKYLCESGCIAVVEGNLVQDRPILPREDYIRAKIIRWTDQRLLFTFAPVKLKIHSLMKLTDGIFAGLVATLLFYLVFAPMLARPKVKN